MRCISLSLSLSLSDQLCDKPGVELSLDGPLDHTCRENSIGSTDFLKRKLLTVPDAGSRRVRTRVQSLNLVLIWGKSWTRSKAIVHARSTKYKVHQSASSYIDPQHANYSNNPFEIMNNVLNRQCVYRNADSRSFWTKSLFIKKQLFVRRNGR